METTGSSPAFPSPPNLTDPSGTVALWFSEPPGAVVQFQSVARGTPQLAACLVGPARDALLARFPGTGPLVLVLDLSRMDGRDPAIRKVLMDGMRNTATRVARALIVPPSGASRVYLASLHAAASLARVFGVDARLKSLPEALRGLRPAA